MRIIEFVFKIEFVKCCYFRYGRWVTRRVAIGGIIVVWLLAGLISFVPISLDLHRNDDQPMYEEIVEVRYPRSLIALIY